MGNIYEPGTILKEFLLSYLLLNKMDQDELNCALWKSDNLLFLKWSVLRQHQT